MTLSNPIALDKFASLPARKEPGQAVLGATYKRSLPVHSPGHAAPAWSTEINKSGAPGLGITELRRNPAAAPTASADRSFVLSLKLRQRGSILVLRAIGDTTAPEASFMKEER